MSCTVVLCFKKRSSNLFTNNLLGQLNAAWKITDVWVTLCLRVK